MVDIEKTLKDYGVGRRSLTDPLFKETYNVCKIFQRKGVTNEDEESLCHKLIEEFPCNACPERFQNLVEFELHYRDAHTFVCAQCKKWKPTSRLLEIHIQENHDSFFKVLAERQPMYQCFVSECDIKFSNPVERREHCFKMHEFPKNYRFDEDLHIKPKNHKQDQQEMQKDSIPKMETDVSPPSRKKESKIFLGKNVKQKTFSRINFNNNNVNGKTQSEVESGVKKPSTVTMFVPRQVQKCYAKTLTKHQEMNCSDVKFENMMDLAKALPDS